MNDYQNWNKTGELIKDAVTDALHSGDFKELNRLVSQTVTSALDEVGIHIPFENDNSPQQKPFSSQASSGNGDLQHGQKQPAPLAEQLQRGQQQLRRRQEQLRQRQQQRMQRSQQSFPQMPDAALSLVKIKRVGSVSGILYQVFGGIGLGVTGIVTLIRLITLAIGATSLTGWIVNFGFLALFLGMIHLGIRQKKRLNRAERYVQLCGYRMFGEIETLAENIGKSCRYVVKDLQKMLRLGMFPEGHLDSGNTCFMLNDVVYRQYLQMENNRIQQEESDKKALETKTTAEAPDEQDAELNAMVAEGMEYIRKLRELNDRIPGDIISQKLFRLENLLKEIFDSIREHREQMHRMHKLMDYYLPTTLKLVEAYEEFDQVSAPGDEIVKAKAEIENTLDTINQAFTELLNNLFQAAVFDATTDAQVLKTMLAKEGLTKDMEFAGSSQK